MAKLPFPRRFAFSLRTLLVLALVLPLGIYFGWRWYSSAMAQRQTIHTLNLERLRAAQFWNTALHTNMGGPPPYDFRDEYNSSRALMEAELALVTTKADRIQAVKGHCQRMEMKFKKVDALFQAGAMGGEAYRRGETESRFIEAQIWLKEEELK